MPIKYEDVRDWGAVPPGETVVATAVQGARHFDESADWAQVWVAAYRTVDFTFLKYAKRDLRVVHTISSDIPTKFVDAKTSYSSQLEEVGQVHLPIESAISIALTVIEIAADQAPDTLDSLLSMSKIVKRRG